MTRSSTHPHTLLRALLAALFLLLFSPLSKGQTCKASSKGRSCGNTLASSIQGRTMRLTLKGPGNTSGFVLLGSKFVTVPLPGLCFLYTLPVASFPYSIGMTGTWSTSFALPKSFKGMAYFQTLAFLRARPGYMIRVSNGLELSCK